MKNFTRRCISVSTLSRRRAICSLSTWRTFKTHQEALSFSLSNSKIVFMELLQRPLWRSQGVMADSKRKWNALRVYCCAASHRKRTHPRVCATSHKFRTLSIHGHKWSGFKQTHINVQTLVVCLEIKRCHVVLVCLVGSGIWSAETVSRTHHQDLHSNRYGSWYRHVLTSKNPVCCYWSIKDSTSSQRA